MWKKCGRTGQLTDAKIIRRMSFACWIIKAANALPQCVIPTAFPRQQGYSNAPQCYVFAYTARLVFYTYLYNRPLRTLIFLLTVGIMIHYVFITTVVAGDGSASDVRHNPGPNLNGPWTRPNLNHKSGSHRTSFRNVRCSTKKIHNESSSETPASTFFTSYSLELV